MRILRDYQFAPEEDRGASVAIGNFDGVHLGHRVVIDAAADKARELGVRSGVLTFEPHPREFFQPDTLPFRLMSAETRAHRLEKLGVEQLYELGFTQALSGLTAEEFARDVLAEGLGLAHVVVGQDFHFGKGRTGTAETLQALGEINGFGVYAVFVDVLNGPNAGAYRGAASLGVKPTFGIHTPNIETYLFDFQGDLYGEDLSVALVEYLRPEETYDDLAALVRQMKLDCARARDILDNIE